MSEENDDKQFDASAQKLRRAREKGDIPRSPEVNAALMYLGAMLALCALAPVLLPSWVNTAVAAMGAQGFSHPMDLAAALWRQSVGITLLIVALPAGMILFGLFVQQSIIFSPEKLNIDPKRINPFRNAAQKFGKSGLVTFAISVGKATCVSFGMWLLLQGFWAELSTSNMTREGQWIAGLPRILTKSLGLALAIATVFALIDWFWKRHEYLQRQKMSMKEVKDEHKDSEGDPHMKQARRQKAVDLVMGQMLADVETADVVIVNPTHYAVALKWDRGSGRAPICVARGVDEMAARIRERATEHGVPIHSDPPTARALYATVQPGEEIRRDHFAAVALAIRFAQTIRAKRKRGFR